MAIKPLYLLILLAVILLGVLLYIFVRPKSPAADVQPAIPAPLAQNLTYEILATYPHDAACYTQGLVIDEGVFYESCGLYGQSSLRRVNPSSGAIQAESTMEAAR